MTEAPNVNVIDILIQLPKLSSADFAKVETAVKERRDSADKALSSLGGTVVPVNGGKRAQHGVANPWGELLLDCIIEVTRDTIGYPIAKETLRDTSAYQSFRRKLPALIEFIEHAAPEYHQRRAIIKLGMELLFGYLHRPDRMTGPTTLMQQIHRLPDALNAQFPGYASAGLLGLIAREG